MNNKEENQPGNNLVLEQRFPMFLSPKILFDVLSSLALGFEVFIYPIPFVLNVPQILK